MAQIGEEVEEVEVWPIEVPSPPREVELPEPRPVEVPVETPARA